jgi:hypothetical protein
MNKLGKLLVLLHTALSVVAMAGALGVFLQFVDWGWKEPRKQLDQRVASEYDKRAAALKEAAKARDIAFARVKPAQDALRDAQQRFAGNHLVYLDKLDKLRNAIGALEVKEIKYNKDGVVLDTPGKVTGLPVFELKVDGIEKSYSAYQADLKKINGEIDDTVKETRKWTEALEAISDQLLGKNGAPGLYALLEDEKKAQDQAFFEKEYLQPRWARALEEAELFMSRRVGLEQTLQGLKKSPKKK